MNKFYPQKSLRSDAINEDNAIEYKDLPDLEKKIQRKYDLPIPGVVQLVFLGGIYHYTHIVTLDSLAIGFAVSKD